MGSSGDAFDERVLWGKGQGWVYGEHNVVDAKAMCGMEAFEQRKITENEEASWVG
jgi:hypothetical protein